MKMLILYGAALVLTMLLVNGPIEAQAMDDGMMNGGGYHGYEMGPGTMHYGGYQSHGMGSSMMGPGEENSLQHNQNRADIDRNGAKRIFKNYIKSEHDPKLRLGKIQDEGSFFEANVVNPENTLVGKLMVNKDTGHLRSIY
ncbi:MAG: hypothetical protein P8185_18595 [Deltaproteobacteria bacterium]|jgi:hypothetical protein